MKSGAVANSEGEIGPPNASLGVVLFSLYAILFAAFVALNLVVPEIMTREDVPLTAERTLSLKGMNVALVSGLGLILATIFLVLIFMRFDPATPRLIVSACPLHR